jgi:hypothetical protein
MRAVLPTYSNKSPPDQNLETMLDSKFQLPPNLDLANACHGLMRFGTIFTKPIHKRISLQMALSESALHQSS